MLIPNYIEYVMMRLEENGHKAYLVGGSVRDMFTEKENDIHDFDVATSATPGEVSSLFNKVIPTGIEYGTVTIQLRGESVEVTTLRKDGAYRDGRHPESVSYTDDLYEDLSRRDFTMNAVAIDLERNVYDPFGGLKDIERGIIRAVGDPRERFSEDPLRMMRAVRFSVTREGYIISPTTLMAISECSSLIQKVSNERIRDELCKILLASQPSAGINTLTLTNLTSNILPELWRCVGFQQHNPHHKYDVYEHTMEVLDNTPPRLNVRLAALLHDIGKPSTFTLDEKGVGHFYRHHIVGEEMCYQTILPRLKFDRATINAVSTLVREHTLKKGLKQGAIKKMIDRVGVENLEDLFDLQRADILGCKANRGDLESINKLEEEIKRILESKEALTLKDLAVNGDDLIELGFKPGPKLGCVLKALLSEVHNKPELNTVEDLLGIAASRFSHLVEVKA